ncbi:bifunctional tRNA (5-methylaminomethyl-2-thiouridine)(34)-methyltransferase MnmD/FAD-dependent 5-carboxymethylaminomethyl-2-thiouridine(34) oxidoreductase MnmC [Ketobacter sp.]|uniref:bifunctional tRNA (5-methylaminomethyl-2-thiouridine)(34)-methyltransferase MnmD/FAD-dependent 5-carboxymethylaminomethyl-2-thiouridine(34) oxidoreductase MnmC n=1 Tax=Ketobacter sp. TaxID=2083498 RepID=UPI000F29739C|nr:bifunctional tRNA (5-methylaminomethyl-2-thiouridine)(34)-methyltransferase MnmD/FAD-dependent 5-carboxymethylaminomethyl-2-thiouridine(34) oxidoreductase MnmC [Ketobacter sp.]RLU01644.1 MAG: bifunctional tRNA (5-methylaminomethyl-2-thiouridine)(34)-methyltransferase MnmD/FAD-dependent 5-carboxymethylaminomethyl-2-thiouridine(34) oxidoreductase MnmC [Ketobacter sp.]
MNQPPSDTPPAPRSRIVPCARIEWQDRTPVSDQFEDVYFSREVGREETRYVFLQNNDLEARWSENGLRQFTIAETGFGTGLNFYCAAELWRHCKAEGHLQANAHLHFVSVEKHPLTRADLARAADQWPSYDWISDPLLEQYPAPVRGYHRLYFSAANITLTLILDDASTGFSTLEGRVDAWFLDGFAPAKNPGMWQEELFQHIARLSHPRTTVATFTAAGVVKRGLQEVGFKMEKVAGFGRKRDMLRGQFQGVSTEETLAPEAKPWFHFHYPGPGQSGTRAAVIGAGLAGATVANSLARRGWRVTVLEQASTIASQGSGNPTGVTFTKLSLHDTPQNRFYQWAYLYACRYLLDTLRNSDAIEGKDWNLNGVLRLAFDAKEAAEQASLLQEQYWPPELMQGLGPEQIQQQLGLQTDLSGMLLPGGGWLNPAVLCQTLLDHQGIELRTAVAVQTLQRRDNQWQVDDLGPFDAVVLANAFGSNQFEQTRHLPLKSVRGQITYCPATTASSQLQHAINYHGYINPAREGFHCVGATFNPRLDCVHSRPEDHHWNLEQLRQTLPSLAQDLALAPAEHCEGRVGFRCQTPDYLPIIGPLPDVERYSRAFSDLGKGFLKRTFPYGPNHAGLLISCGHGSRGITSACLAAEIIASYLTGEPQPLDREALFAIHPARFLIRNIIRRQHPQ